MGLLKRLTNASMLFLLTLFAGVIAAQTARPARSQNFSLHIVDADNLGIRALVRLNAEDQREIDGYTDWTGWATFQDVPTAEYRVEIEFNGERLHVASVKLKGQGTKRTTMHLKSVNLSDRYGTIPVEELAVPTDAYRYYLSGIKSMRAGKLESAANKFKLAIGVFPRHARTYNALGVVLHMKAKHMEAEEAFRGAIALQPQFTEARLNLGNLLMELHRNAEAKNELQLAFDSDPQNIEAMQLLLDSMLMTHDELSAEQLARSLHQLGIPHPGRIHANLGTALTAHSMLVLAAKQYATLLQEGSSDAERAHAEAALTALNTSPESAVDEAREFHSIVSAP